MIDLENRTTLMQQAHLDLVNELALFKVKNRAEHATFESNINLLKAEIDKLKEELEEVMVDRNAMALVVDKNDEKIKKLEPKQSIFNRIFR